LGQKVVIVGIGIAGMVHARVLEGFPEIALVAGIDPCPRDLTFRGNKVPVYPSLFEMTADTKNQPDIVVVATPTPTHAQVCGEVAEYFGQASIIVEKPAADNLEDVQRIVHGIGGKQPVTVAYHMAFSPVVEWGVRETASRADQLGTPVLIDAWAADPYQADVESAQQRLANSWTDSGINALSIIERFARPVARTSLRQIESRARSVFEGAFLCETGGRQVPASIMTSWYSTEPSRWTRIPSPATSGKPVRLQHFSAATGPHRAGRPTTGPCTGRGWEAGIRSSPPKQACACMSCCSTTPTRFGEHLTRDWRQQPCRS
jgi:hypothetical protein